MKKNILILLVIIFSTTKIFSDTKNCQIHFIGKMNNLSLEKDSKIIIHDLLVNPLTLSTKNLIEPTKITIVDSLRKRKVNFYLESSNYTIEIKASDLSINSIDSKLNREYFQYIHIIDSFNVSIDSNKRALEKIKNLEFNPKNNWIGIQYSERTKVLEYNLKKCLYQWCLKHTGSFVCFDFIQYMLEEKQVDSILVQQLFSNLDKSLFDYPTYKKYKLLFDENILNNNPTSETTLEHFIDTTVGKPINKTTFWHKTSTTLKVVGKRIQDYQLLIDNELIIDSLKKINVIYRNITEPIKATLINLNDTSAILKKSLKSLRFYLDIGVQNITINLDKSTIVSNTSKLNNETNMVMKIKKHYDTLMNVMLRKDSIENSNLGFISDNSSFDSISHQYHRAYYNKCFSIPNSFIALDFTVFLLDAHSQVGITKKEVVKLFNILGKSLKKYPTYIETKKSIELHFLNANTENQDEVINKPLWQPK